MSETVAKRYNCRIPSDSLFGANRYQQVVIASDYDALAQQHLELESENGKLSAECDEHLRDLCESRKERDALQAKLRRIEAIAECGSVQNWLSLPDEEKAKWFALHVEQDCERIKFRSDALALRELVAECADYLNTNEMTSISHGSILHRKMMEALPGKEGGK